MYEIRSCQIRTTFFFQNTKKKLKIKMDVKFSYDNIVT